MSSAYAGERTDVERAFCNSEFERITGEDSRADASNKVAAWKALEPKCSGTGTYEARLVGLMAHSGKLDDARRFGLGALERPLVSKRGLWVALSEVESRANDPAKAIVYSKRAIEADPDWSGGHASLGETLLSQRRYAEAIPSLEAAYERERSVNLVASLSFAYWGVKRYADSADAMKAALKADPKALRFTKAIAAAADSLVHLGKAKAAQQLLLMHAQSYPEGQQDPDFRRSLQAADDALGASAAQ
jgi:tetratricopeptide (TPR) repeat protein